MFKTQVINDVKVHPIPQQKDCEAFKGHEICKEPFANIFEVGRKKKGKTSVILELLKRFCGKHTHVFIFCSTIHKDDSWKYILSWLDKMKIGHTEDTSLVGNLQALIDHLSGVEEEKRPYPNYIFVFDDLGEEIGDKSLTALLKKNRHFRCKVIISSQNLKDIPPQARRQIDLWLLFSGLSENILKTVHQDADFPVGLEKFVAGYKQATTNPYSFMYAGDDYRSNFSEKIII